jgi:ATP-dependent Clp protease ATP-binding subunit ClpX
MDYTPIRQYITELELDGIQLEIDEAVYDLIVDKCVDKETGARGLKSLITEYLEEACFEVYSAPQPKNIKLFVKDKEIQWDLF